jgi:3-phytase
MFVIASSKEGESADSLHQYRLLPDGLGKVKGVYVRAFGQGAIFDKVEGLVADDELGFIYAADEEAAIRKFHADPDKGDNNEIAVFALEDGIKGDREGLTIYRSDSKTGFLLLSSQGGKNVSLVKIYRREGDGGNPHKHELLSTINTIGTLQTDGLDVTNRSISPQFPHGFLVKHDSPGRNFKLYSWDDIAKGFMKSASSDTTTRQGQ